QEAENVQVMDAHVEEGQAVVRLEKRLPVRTGSHLDRGQNRRAQNTALEQILERPHRLIVAHVLVDRQGETGIGAQVDDLPCLVGVQSERLLRQDTAEVVGVLYCLLDNLQLEIRWEGKIDDLDLWVGQKLSVGIVDAGNAPLSSDRSSVGRCPRSDRGHGEAGLLVGRQLNVADDEPGADHADSIIRLRWKVREVVEINR